MTLRHSSLLTTPFLLALLAGCTPPLPPAAPPPPVASGSPALVLAVRPLLPPPPGSLVLTALTAARPTPTPTAALPAAEITIRTDDGRTLTLVQRPPPSLHPDSRIWLIQAGGAARLVPTP